MATLDDIETRLQSLVEVQLAKYIPGFRSEDEVAHLLAVAMYTRLVRRGEIFKAPNLFTIFAHPTTLTHWNAEARLLAELGNAVMKTGSEAGFIFTSRPRIITSADASMRPGRMRVKATFSTEPMVDTRGITAVDPQSTSSSDDIPIKAFLIQDGTKIIPLNRSVINIGRRMGNHIVIDDPRVSRTHAQVRLVNGRFVLFDLDSTGGTFVNGQRANQTVLYPGDVISLAGISLIYGQDILTGRLGDGITRPGNTLFVDRPTAVFKRFPDE